MERSAGQCNIWGRRPGRFLGRVPSLWKFALQRPPSLVDMDLSVVARRYPCFPAWLRRSASVPSSLAWALVLQWASKDWWAGFEEYFRGRILRRLFEGWGVVAHVLPPPLVSSGSDTPPAATEGSGTDSDGTAEASAMLGALIRLLQSRSEGPRGQR